MLVNAHSHIDCLGAIMIADKNAVFSRILHVNVVDSDGAACGLLCYGKLVLVNNLSVVTKPEDLWCWLTINEARQTQSLRRGQR